MKPQPVPDVNSLFLSLRSSRTRFEEWVRTFELPRNTQATKINLLTWPTPKEKANV